MTDKGLRLHGFIRMYGEDNTVKTWHKPVPIMLQDGSEDLHYVIEVHRSMVDYDENDVPIVEPNYYAEVLLEQVGNPEHVVHIEYNALWSVEEIEKNIEALIRSGVFAGMEEKLK